MKTTGRFADMFTLPQKGHEAIQIATGLQLLPCDFVSPYYRDRQLTAFIRLRTLRANAAIAGKG
jgi:TPP-dependent pyruvate/acetoin dehydrogenase alpha subunit